MSLPTSDLRHRDSESIAAAYDSIAARYDSQLIPAEWIRLRLWERLDALFPRGARLLDVTAGTGLDALHLAERGVEVIACDISSEMLAQLHRKNPSIETRLVDFNQLDFDEPFDGIIGTFAGLNTSPDLNQFSRNAARLLRPSGVLFIHLLNRLPLLEIANQFIHLHWRACWRTMTSSRRDVNVGNIILPHYLYSPLSLYRNTFAKDFRLRRIQGHGFLRPLDVSWGGRLDGVDRRLASVFPFHSLGIFFSLEMTRV